MPMLTGTLITAAGFLPIGLAKSMTGEYTFAIFAVTSAALLISWGVSVYFVPYLGARLLHTRVKAHEPDGSVVHAAARDLRLAVLHALPPRGRVVPGPSLDHHRRDHRHLRAGPGGHGPGAAAVLPRLEPARDHGRPVAARGRHDQAERGRRPSASRRACSRSRASSRSPRGWAAACRASTCRWTRCSRRATSARPSSSRST